MSDKSKGIPVISQVFQLQNEVVSSINRARRNGLCHEDLVHCLLHVASLISVVGQVDMDNNVEVFKMMFKSASDEMDYLKPLN